MSDGTGAAQSSGALAHEERKQLKKIEKEIEKLEKRKIELTEKLYDPALTLDDIQKYSAELATVNSNLEEKEMEWLEKSDG
jgi:ATP-binding cassette subfamily F protein uup